MQYLGDYTEDYATLNFKFSTHKADGTPITLAGSPAISVYKANGTTQSTAGITLTVDFDSVTGLNNVLIDLSADAFYAVANDYQVVITTGTVNSISVVGTVLAHFSIENRFAETDVVKIGGVAQSATDLKDFVDTGYDPSTHKVQGVVLTDTTTTNTDMRGTNNALLATNYTAPDNASITAILADTSELQTDWKNTGRLDTILDDALGYAAATRTALTDNRAANLDKIVGTILSGNHVAQSGDSFPRIGANGSGLTALGDTRITDILADTAEIQTELANGGRTDLLIDSIINTLSTISGYVDELESRLTAQRAANLDELGSANIPADIDTLLTRLTSARALYLDKLNITGNVAATGEAASALSSYDPPTKAELDAATILLANYIDTEIADIKIATDKLNSMIQLDGTDNQFKAVALELAPGGGSGGSATVENQELILAAVSEIIPHGDIAWLTGGGMSGSNAITINAHDGDGANVVEASVEIWDSTGGTFYEKKFSNSSGQAVFNMDNGTYTVKMHKAGYSFENQALTVPVVTPPVYTGTAYNITPAADPDMCKIYTILRARAGVFPESVVSELSIQELPHAIGDAYYAEVTPGTYDATKGELYWIVVRGATVSIAIPGYGVQVKGVVDDVALESIEDFAIRASQ